MGIILDPGPDKNSNPTPERIGPEPCDATCLDDARDAVFYCTLLADHGVDHFDAAYGYEWTSSRRSHFVQRWGA